jgi:hypothetical protein
MSERLEVMKVIQPQDLVSGHTKKILYVSKIHAERTYSVWKEWRYPNESCRHLQVPMDTVSKEISTFAFPFIGNPRGEQHT